MKIFLLVHMCHFAVGLTHCYKKQFFLHLYCFSWQINSVADDDDDIMTVSQCIVSVGGAVVPARDAASAVSATLAAARRQLLPSSGKLLCGAAALPYRSPSLSRPPRLSAPADPALYRPRLRPRSTSLRRQATTCRERPTTGTLSSCLQRVPLN